MSFNRARLQAPCDMLGNFPITLAMKSLALGAIRFYQRFLSPRKGFCCAYASISGHASCSALGYRAIRRHGVWRGMAVLDKRLKKCGVAYRRYRRPAVHGPLARQAGFLDCGACDAPAGCDLSCGGLSGCDMPDISHFCGDLLSSGGCGSGGCGGCDWLHRKQANDGYVVIPVRSNIVK